LDEHDNRRCLVDGLPRASVLSNRYTDNPDKPAKTAKTAKNTA
jgi:hypothetical protein